MIHQTRIEQKVRTKPQSAQHSFFMVVKRSRVSLSLFYCDLCGKEREKNFYQLSSLFIVVTFVALEASSVKMDFCTPPIYNLISEAFGVFAL